MGKVVFVEFFQLLTSQLFSGLNSHEFLRNADVLNFLLVDLAESLLSAAADTLAPLRHY
jgi:hypothetical protein